MATDKSDNGQATQDIARTIQRLRNAITLFGTPYNAGYNCGATWPTEINSHPCWFSAPALTEEWERGKRDGEQWKIRNAPAAAHRMIPHDRWGARQ